MDTIKDSIQALDNAGFTNLLRWMYGEEQPRREAQPVVEQAKQEAESETATKISQQLAEEHPELVEKAAGEEDGEVREWQPWHPLRESTHYRYGYKTRHGGRVWRDVLDPTGDKLNVWEPGSEGIDERYWVEETDSESSETPDTSGAPETSEQPTAPAFKQPSGSHDAYSQGDRVTYNGEVYESLINANAYSPADYPQGWKKL